ncbi:MAG: hypothetical protein K1060chlam5_00925 [Candidatus Anoxychlamydiales bacterium]|nr:hypothetical protein [Candidatus Anoxychlamydiales bacterium]
MSFISRSLLTEGLPPLPAIARGEKRRVDDDFIKDIKKAALSALKRSHLKPELGELIKLSPEDRTEKIHQVDQICAILKEEIAKINFSREYEKENLHYPTLEEIKLFTNKMLQLQKLYNKLLLTELQGYTREKIKDVLDTLEQKIARQALFSRKNELQKLTEEDEDFEIRQYSIPAHIEALETKNYLQFVLEFRDFLGLQLKRTDLRMPPQDEQQMFRFLLKLVKDIYPEKRIPNV